MYLVVFAAAAAAAATTTILPWYRCMPPIWLSCHQACLLILPQALGRDALHATHFPEPSYPRETINIYMNSVYK